MSKVDRKEIAYYGQPIETLSREKLLQAFEELASAIQDCAIKGNKCQEIIHIKRKSDSKE
jgi:hypothetical protein